MDPVILAAQILSLFLGIVMTTSIHIKAAFIIKQNQGRISSAQFIINAMAWATFLTLTFLI